MARSHKHGRRAKDSVGRGTPEYSLHICGLLKLFPQARFVHVFRDVDAVVRSMVNFHRGNRNSVGSERRRRV